MAFAKGNLHGAKPKRFGEALTRALAQYESDKVATGHALRAIADSAIAQAIAGDLDAIKFVAERLDGKPDASVDIAVRRSARDLTDDELASIAAGSSDGTTDEAGSESES